MPCQKRQSVTSLQSTQFIIRYLPVNVHKPITTREDQGKPSVLHRRSFERQLPVTMITRVQTRLTAPTNAFNKDEPQRGPGIAGTSGTLPSGIQPGSDIASTSGANYRGKPQRELNTAGASGTSRGELHQGSDIASTSETSRGKLPLGSDIASTSGGN